MDLNILLEKQNCLHYSRKFVEEEIDIEALALLAPLDLRAACGVPLGPAAKLIHAGQHACEKLHDQLQSLATVEAEGVDEASTVDVETLAAAALERHIARTAAALAKQAIPEGSGVCQADSEVRQATPINSATLQQSTCHADSPQESAREHRSEGSQTPRGVTIETPKGGSDLRTSAEVQSSSPVVTDASRHGTDNFDATYQIKDKLFLPSPTMAGRYGIVGSAASQISSLWKFLMTIRHTARMIRPVDIAIPVDHSESFKLCTVYSKTGEALKKYLTSVAQTWILIESLALGVIASLVGALPQGAGDTEKVIWELLVTCSLVSLVLNLVAWSVIYIVVDTIGERNMKAFAIAALGALQSIEFGVVSAIYFWMSTIFFLTYTRVCKVAPEASWPRIIWIVIVAVQLINLQICVQGVSLLGMNSGAMSDAVIPGLPKSSDRFEKRTFDCLWSQCRLRSSRLSAVKYYLEGGTSPASSVSSSSSQPKLAANQQNSSKMQPESCPYDDTTI